MRCEEEPRLRLAYGRKAPENVRPVGQNLFEPCFGAARLDQQKTIEAQPNYGPALCVLGLIDAGLDRKAEALHEGSQALDLLPLTKDAVGGVEIVKCFATIAAWVDEKDLAFEQLEIVTGHPSSISYGQLKLLPFWDPLRSDPRFEKVVASLAQK